MLRQNLPEGTCSKHKAKGALVNLIGPRTPELQPPALQPTLYSGGRLQKSMSWVSFGFFVFHF